MNRFVKLFHFELHRIRYWYGALLVLTLLLQVAGVMEYAISYKSRFQEAVLREGISAGQYVADYGAANFIHYSSGFFFSGPIAICAAVLLIYTLFIWYRDWVGKNMFVYRLLMIPTSRMNVFAAKLSTIMLLTLGLVGFELLVVPLQLTVFNTIMPAELRETFNIVEVFSSHTLLQILVPNRLGQLLLYYAAGLAFVIVVFTGIMLERSYRWKGAIAGVAYVVASIVLFLMPLIASETFYRYYLYDHEVFWLLVGAGILIAGCSLALSSYLLKNKVTV
ncbi:hypothetical protein ACFFK0_21720 [Paenibacillus chartarius]|uniref:ABC transporter permease n=1 Tax=Paenibacillus chartarius TaxID=747481 RepID=A0ABV6DQT5_9BACL